MKNTEKLIEILNRYNINHTVINTSKNCINISITSTKHGFREITLHFDDDMLFDLSDEFDLPINCSYIVYRDIKLFIDKVHQLGIDRLSRQYREKWYYISTITNTEWIGDLING